MSEAPRILIYRLGFLGDTIVALPGLRLIAKAFPRSERWLLTNFTVGSKTAPVGKILEGTGLVHGYIEYPLGLRNIAELMRLRKRIAALNIQLLIYLAEPRGHFKTLRDALFFKSCGIKNLIGVPYSKEMRSPRRLAGDLFEYEGARLTRSIAELGKISLDDPASFDLSLTDGELSTADLAIKPIAEGRPLISVSIGAKVDTKDWGDSNWAALLKMLSMRLRGWGLVFIGSRDEYNRCARLSSSWTGRSLNLCGQLEPRVSAAAIKRCAVFVGHDSGPMHLAEAVRTPCVAIFSSRNLPGVWFPQGKRHHIFYQRLPCQGCNLDVCVKMRKACIRSISVEAVYTATVNLASAAAQLPASKLPDGTQIP